MVSLKMDMNITRVTH